VDVTVVEEVKKLYNEIFEEEVEEEYSKAKNLLVIVGGAGDEVRGSERFEVYFFFFSLIYLLLYIY
jgi:hypothetical protein